MAHSPVPEEGREPQSVRARLRAEMRYAVFNSTGEDTDNRYLSTVVVESPSSPYSCSGVLLHPSLVLTAAHCVCPPDGNHQLVSGMKCSKSATVTAHIYEKNGEGQAPIRQSRTGTVFAHKKFKARLDDQKAVVDSTSDVAVIFLKEAMRGIPLGFQLTEADVQLKSSMTLVGFGLSAPMKGVTGRRLFGTNEVTGMALTNLADKDDNDVAFLFEKPGSHAAPGDSGGPCFRETPQGRWLVGIVSQSSGDGRASRMTSLYPHLLWLKEQIEKAERLGSSGAP